MRRLRFSSLSFRSKFIVTHLLVAFTVTIMVVGAMVLIAPALHSNLMGAVATPDHTMTLETITGLFIRTLLYSVLLAGSLAVLVAVAVSILVSRQMSQPVQRVLAASQRVASGRYNERVSVESNDELGALSESFNSMAASLDDVERRRRELIGDVSHELRTPIATIEGYLEALRDGVLSPNEEIFKLLLGESARMWRLVEDMQELSSAESAHVGIVLAPTAIDELVRQSSEHMQPLFREKGVRLEVKIAPDLPLALADSQRLMQLMTNLLTNAFRYTPEGGSVSVGIDCKDSYVVVSVTDTGKGIAAEDLGRVFERFYRVDKSRSRLDGGAGIGLAICRALIQAMGGSITARSQGLGQGAAFSVSIPRYNRETTSARR